MGKLHLLAGITFALAVPAFGQSSSNRVSPGEVLIEPPTLQALGFEWSLQGDANRNSSVVVHYRKKGAADWRQGLPLMRLGGEETKYQAYDVVVPPMFAGSVFDLEPDTPYEVRLRMEDKDGVDGDGGEGGRGAHARGAEGSGRWSRVSCVPAGLHRPEAGARVHGPAGGLLHGLIALRLGQYL